MTTEQRDAIESELRALARVRDPVPVDVVEAAIAAFTLRNLDAELAELTYDSLSDQSQLAGVRGSGGTRQLTFEGPDFVLDVQIELSGERRMAGQISPPTTSELELRHRGGTMSAPVDAAGRFVLSPTPHGPICLKFPEYGGRRLATIWVAV